MMSEINVIDALAAINNNCSYEAICEFSPDKKQKYKQLLQRVKAVNEQSLTTTEKGKALEALVTFLLKASGGIFEVHTNLRTHTNEIDQLMQLTPSGKSLLAHGLIDFRYNSFIAECKNYNGKVDVTYVGKFCSLLLTNNVKLGVLFSYKGITGAGWSDASGLVRKFYLHKEKSEDRFCIIDFNYTDFEAILNGENFLSLIDAKLNALKYDTEYSRFLSPHPAVE